jgi:hypothetical protein
VRKLRLIERYFRKDYWKAEAAMISLIVIGVAICAASAASAIAFAQERNGPSFIQLLGAGCLAMVVLAHVAERFDFFPSDGGEQPAM